MPVHTPIVLVVDDEESIREVLTRLNETHGRTCITAASIEEALERFHEDIPDLAIIDLGLPDGNGLDLLKRIREIDATLPVIVFTGVGTVERAVEAMQLGATDFLEKPLELTPLEARIDRALELGALRREVQHLRGTLGALSEAGLIGRSKCIRELIYKIRRVAETPSTTVLIEGESGSGKELVARAVHLASSRRERRFLAVNCAALSESLLEAELFGYERGSFTGASSAGKLGLFQAAEGGTLLLDEIGEMSTGLQSKLLRVIQERQIRRVGGVETIPIDVRIIASTNRNLAEEVERGHFRKDLYYRLNVMLIRSAPLRERRTDIPILAQHFLDQCLTEIRRPIRGFSRAAMRRLRRYHWPGNVRELKNIIERAVINSPGPLVKVRHLDLPAPPKPAPAAAGDPVTPHSGVGIYFGDGDAVAFSTASSFLPDVAEPQPSRPPAALAAAEPPRAEEAESAYRLALPDLSIATAERELIKLVLKETGWNRSRAANLLGINRTTLYDKLKLYEITPPPKGDRKPSA